MLLMDDHIMPVAVQNLSQYTYRIYSLFVKGAESVLGQLWEYIPQYFGK